MIDILPALKDGDSSCETRMPARGNVPGGIHVAVVHRSTATSPFSALIHFAVDSAMDCITKDKS